MTFRVSKGINSQSETARKLPRIDDPRDFGAVSDAKVIHLRALNSDKKLSIIFQATDTKDQIVRKIKRGYLNGRAMTMIIDSLPTSTSSIHFDLAVDSKIHQITLNSIIFKQVNRLSAIPFCLRRWFCHNLKMKYNNKYKTEFIRKAHVLAKSYLLAVQEQVTPHSKSAISKIDNHQKSSSSDSDSLSDPNIVKIKKNLEQLDADTPENIAIRNSLLEVASNNYVFSQRALKPPLPQTFQGGVISKFEVQQLLNTHQDIFNEVGTGPINHGTPYGNILEAYDVGVNILHGQQNQEFITKVQQVLTLINQKTAVNQKSLIRSLATGFKGCRPGRIDAIDALLDKLLSVDLGFEGQVDAKFNRFKVQVLERLIWKNHPDAATNTIPQNQFQHLKSGYVIALADDFGLRGKDTAQQDQNHHHLYFNLDIVKQQYRTLLNASFNEFCESIAQEANASNQDESMCDITTKKLYQWIGEKTMNGEVPNQYGFYSKFKTALYARDSIPTEEQIDQFEPYLAVAEVKQMLQMLGFAQEV